MSEIVKELRELAGRVGREGGRHQHGNSPDGPCLACSLEGFARRIGGIADKLEAQSVSAENADQDIPETPEEETARRSLEFAKWADLLVECDEHDGSGPHYFVPGRERFFNRCVNPRLAESLTVDVVLPILRKKGFEPRIIDDEAAVGFAQPWMASVWVGDEWHIHVGPTPILALLRALDAAGVMDKKED